MIKTFLLSLLAAALVLSAGCLSSKKSKRAKESTEISADVEESLRKRWVEKRAAELTAGGTAAEGARTQAENEFRERYNFTSAGKK